MDAGVKKAVDAAGSISELARRLGITRGAICQWHKIPAGKLVKVEEVTGVPRRLLRPELYAPPARSRHGRGRAA